MKSTKKMLASVMLTAAALASCSKEAADQGTGTPTGQPATVSLMIDTNGQTSRSLQSRADANATEGEATLKKLVVYIFDDQDALEKAEDIDMTTHTPDADNVVKVDLAITSGSKKFYAVANTDLGTISKVGDFTKKVLDLADITALTGADEQEFVMSSTGEVAKTILPSTDGVAATNNTIRIPISRLAAKVTVAKDQNVTVTGGTIENIEYRVRQIPNKVNLYGDGMTPPYASVKPDAQNMFDNGDNGGGSFSFTAGDGVAAEYMTENYFEQDKAMKGNATYLSIRAKFTPDPAQVTGGALGGDGTFWRIANVDADGAVVSVDTGYYASKAAADKVIDGATGKQAVEYKDGVGYYTLYLTQKVDATAPAHQKYAVHRNDYFKVTLKSVGGSGLPEEPEITDPEEPVETDAQLVVEIAVEDWNVVDMDGEI